MRNWTHLTSAPNKGERPVSRSGRSNHETGPPVNTEHIASLPALVKISPFYLSQDRTPICCSHSTIVHMLPSCRVWYSPWRLVDTYQHQTHCLHFKTEMRNNLIPSKRWYTSTNLYGDFASQKKVISMDMYRTLKRNNIDFKKAE